MTLEEMQALFEKYQDAEYIQFDRIENPRTKRPDLHAFLLLDELVPLDPNKRGSHDIIGASTHDEFFISIDPEDLAPVISEAQILELIRCGVMYDAKEESFSMFA